MPSGTIRWLDKHNSRCLIRPDDRAEDLFVDCSGNWRGDKPLAVGQRVRFDISEGPHGRKASRIVMLPPVDLRIDERIIDGPEPIERTLMLDSEPVAVAYLDNPPSEATLAWPLVLGVQMEDVIDVYLKNFLSAYSRPSTKILEFCIGDECHQLNLGVDADSQSVLQVVNARCSDNGGLELLQISSKDSLMELLFDQSAPGPVRLALVMSAAPFESLVHLFSSFHRNDRIRTNPGVAEYAFAPNSQRSPVGFKSLLDPLTIFWEAKNDFESFLSSQAG